MSQALLLYSVEDGVACITLNRPESLNSFNTEMHAEMRKVLKAVRQDSSVRALLLTGNGRGFCAGQDLSDRSVAPGEQAPTSASRWRNATTPCCVPSRTCHSPPFVR